MSLYRVAIVLVLVSGFAAAMYFFLFWMPEVIEDWKNSDKELTAIEMLAARTTFWWVQYWYLPAGGAIAMAMMILFAPVSWDKRESQS